VLTLILVIPVLADGEMPTPKFPLPEPTPTPNAVVVYEEPAIVADDQAGYYVEAISFGFDIAKGVLSLF
jgi:hypothetical protein